MEYVLGLLVMVGISGLFLWIIYFPKQIIIFIATATILLFSYLFGEKFKESKTKCGSYICKQVKNPLELLDEDDE